MAISKLSEFLYSATVTFATLFFTSQSFSADNNIQMGWEPWEPFAFKDSNGRLTGLDVELVTHVFGDNQYEVGFKELPWARLIQSIKYGNVHLAVSAMKTPERENYAYFSEPYQKESYVIFVRKGEASKYKSLKSLTDIPSVKFRLGVMRDCLYGNHYNHLMRNPSFSKWVKPVTTDIQNHKKLLSKRIDGFIQEYSRIALHNRKSGILNDVEPLFVVDENYLHVMFSKKLVSKETVNFFNSRLQKMKTDGSYLNLFKKYQLDRFNMLSENDNARFADLPRP